MSERQDKPDFLDGVALDAIPANGMLAGTVGRHDALLVRWAGGVRVVGATCTHLGAPLSEGLVIDGEIRCPWHHACFDLETGRATKAPAFDALPVWPVVAEGDRVRVAAAQPTMSAPAGDYAAPPGGRAAPGPFVIIGGGAAGYAAAVALKEAAPAASVTVLSDDDHAPYDRTLLTKDYLDGKFGEDRLPISKTSLDGLGVDLRLSARVERIDRAAREVRLAGGGALPYARLLIATGAEPKRLDIPGADRDHVRVLRSLADCRAILGRIGTAKAIVVLGSSFIGLETAASLRSRGLDITVVSPESAPTERLFGAEVSQAIMAVHRDQGVKFKLGRQATAIGFNDVTLDDGSSLPADLVIVGIGVSPRTRLAEDAGLPTHDGIVVDRHLRTSDPEIFAAGDVARWPDVHAGRDIRVEHWVMAQRQGETAATNMLGRDMPFADVPFFWTKHFDLSVRYVGHAGRDAQVSVDGSASDRDATISFIEAGQARAIATLGRDLVSLQEEHRMETSATSD